MVGLFGPTAPVQHLFAPSHSQIVVQFTGFHQHLLTNVPQWNTGLCRFQDLQRQQSSASIARMFLQCTVGPGGQNIFGTVSVLFIVVTKTVRLASKHSKLIQKLVVGDGCARGGRRRRRRQRLARVTADFEGGKDAQV